MQTIVFDSGGASAWGAAATVALEPYIFSGEPTGIDPTQLRLVGSSVGALNAAVLAAQRCRVSEAVYAPQTLRRLVSLQGFLRRVCRCILKEAPVAGDRACNALVVDEAIEILQEQVPDIAELLCQSPLASVEALSWNRYQKRIERRNVLTESDPLAVLRASIAHPAFCDIAEDQSCVDAAVFGAVLTEVIPPEPCPGHRYAVILNAVRSPDAFFWAVRQRCFSLLTQDNDLAQMFLRAEQERATTIEQLADRPDVLLISPATFSASVPATERWDIRRYRTYGAAVAQRIHAFFHERNA